MAVRWPGRPADRQSGPWHPQAAVTGTLVLPASAAFAGDRSNKTERAILGAVIGGIAGAALSDGDRGGIASW